VDRRGRGGNGGGGGGCAVVVVVVVSAVATAGALMPRAAIMATATTPRVLNFIMWTPFKGTRSTVKFEILKTL